MTRSRNSPPGSRSVRGPSDLRDGPHPRCATRSAVPARGRRRAHAWVRDPLNATDVRNTCCASDCRVRCPGPSGYPSRFGRKSPRSGRKPVRIEGTSLRSRLSAGSAHGHQSVSPAPFPATRTPFVTSFTAVDKPVESCGPTVDRRWTDSCDSTGVGEQITRSQACVHTTKLAWSCDYRPRLTISQDLLLPLISLDSSC